MRLIIAQTNNEDNTLMQGISDCPCVPVVGLDLWEHAYWTQHDGDPNGSYVEEFFESIDWGQVSENFEAHNLNGKVAPII